MCNEEGNTDASVSGSVSKPAKRTLPKGMTPFTPDTAKTAAARSAYCRAVRAEMRKKLLEAAVDAGVDKIYLKALKSGDLDSISVVEKAMKLVGLDFASSEESVQRVQANVDAKTDNKVEIVVKGLDG